MLAGAYGWTPGQVVKQIEDYGEEWLMAMVRSIIGDKVDERRWMIAVAPLSRTPDSKKGVRAMQKYNSTLHNSLDMLMPWIKKDKKNRLLEQAERLEKKMKTGGKSKQDSQSSEGMAKKMGLAKHG